MKEKLNIQSTGHMVYKHTAYAGIKLFTRTAFNKLKKEGVLNEEIANRRHSSGLGDDIKPLESTTSLFSLNDLVVLHNLYDYLAENGLDLYDHLALPVTTVLSSEKSRSVPYGYAKRLIEEALTPDSAFRRTDTDEDEGESQLSIELFDTDDGGIVIAIILNKVFNNSNTVYLPQFLNEVYDALVEKFGVSITLKMLNESVFKYLNK